MEEDPDKERITNMLDDETTHSHFNLVPNKIIPNHQDGVICCNHSYKKFFLYLGGTIAQCPDVRSESQELNMSL